MSVGSPYGIAIGKLRIYWTQPWAIWWGDTLLWQSGWYRP